MHSLKPVVWVLAASLFLAGCGRSSGLTHPNPSYTPPAPAPAYGGPTGSGTDLSGPGSGQALGSAGRPSQTSLYFDLDQAQVKPSDQAVILAWAAYLKANPSVKLLLEGHTDERGSTDYNVSLGERRAATVSSALAAQGVVTSSLSTVSYGESRPAATGHDESAWSKNRRVDLVQQ